MLGVFLQEPALKPARVFSKMGSAILGTSASFSKTVMQTAGVAGKVAKTISGHTITVHTGKASFLSGGTARAS